MILSQNLINWLLPEERNRTERTFQAGDHSDLGAEVSLVGARQGRSRMWRGTVCILIRFEKSLQGAFLSFPSIMDYLKQGPLFFFSLLVHQSIQINRISAKSYMCPQSFLAGICYICLFLLPLHPGLGQDVERVNIINTHQSQNPDKNQGRTKVNLIHLFNNLCDKLPMHLRLMHTDQKIIKTKTSQLQMLPQPQFSRIYFIFFPKKILIFILQRNPSENTILLTGATLLKV